MKPIFIALFCVLITVVFAGLAACQSKTKDIQSQAEKITIDSPYFTENDHVITVDGLNMRYRDEGPQTAPPVIMVHGFSSSLETWDALAAAMSLPAAAQSSSSSAPVSFGGNAPIEITAERAAYKGAVTVLSGDVDVRQGGARIRASRMDLFREDLGKLRANLRPSAGEVPAPAPTGLDRYGSVNRIDAVGNFKYITPKNSVSGDKGVYERNKNIITVTGNVVFTQGGGNTAKGDKLVYDLTTNRARFDGNCEGSDCDAGERILIKIGQ